MTILAKFQTFEHFLKSEAYVPAYETFKSQLNTYKTSANAAIFNEKTAKDRTKPTSCGQFIWIKKVIQYYFFETSQSQQFFNDQLYISSKNAANSKIEYYDKYWDSVDGIDKLLSIAIWVFVIFFAVLIGFAIASWLMNRRCTKDF